MELFKITLKPLLGSKPEVLFDLIFAEASVSFTQEGLSGRGSPKQFVMELSVL